MFTKNSKRALALATLMAFGGSVAHAGLLDLIKKATIDAPGQAMTNFNANMWGDNGLGAEAIKIGKEAITEKRLPKLTDFNRITDKQNAVNAAAHADVKAMIKAVIDVVLWLPRKLQELFKKALGKVQEFAVRLDNMNKGASIKERLDNLAGGGGGGGGGGAAAAEVMSAGGAEEISFDDAAAFEDELAAASVDAGARASGDAGMGLDGAFGTMMGQIDKGLSGKKKAQGKVRVAKTYLNLLGKAFDANSKSAVTALYDEAPAVFRANPKAMQKAVEKIAAKSGTPLAKGFARATGRIRASISLHRQ